VAFPPDTRSKNDPAPVFVAAMRLQTITQFAARGTSSRGKFVWKFVESSKKSSVRSLRNLAAAIHGLSQKIRRRRFPLHALPVIEFILLEWPLLNPQERADAASQVFGSLRWNWLFQKACSPVG
jgi:hypothetical protein